MQFSPTASQAQTDTVFEWTNVDTLVDALYSSITIEPGGELPDWAYVRSMFDVDAVMALRVAKDSIAIFTRETWIQDFKDFIVRLNIKEKGFTEKIVETKIFEFGDVATAMVWYEAGIPSTETPPRSGVDTISMMRHRGKWRVVSLTNEVAFGDRDIPTEWFH